MRLNLPSIHKKLQQPVDASSMIVFRLFFSGIMIWEVIRYFQYGWVNRYFIKPNFFFPYAGFEWVAPWSGNDMYVHFFVMGVLAVFMFIGLLYRWSAFLFFLCFTFIFLLDSTNYLNHFYLISLISFLMIFILFYVRLQRVGLA